QLLRNASRDHGHRAPLLARIDDMRIAAPRIQALQQVAALLSREQWIALALAWRMAIRARRHVELGNSVDDDVGRAPLRVARAFGAVELARHEAVRLTRERFRERAAHGYVDARGRGAHHAARATARRIVVEHGREIRG